ncbi:MAG: dTDP-4-dehydrorhamnose reductase [Leptospiraceae bacterium]|nr:dTDP-4-dehydrorhamnose reductase [Leptospiraceae bacterium]MCP5503318.1 dTDP-4-dehydrorhamnose reductase [Leptospiraceae bacterium]
MKVLYTGSLGQLGYELQKVFNKKSIYSKGYDIQDWDISSYEISKKVLLQEKPDILINCAAYTAVDKAEEDIELAYRINAEAVKALAELCQEFRIYFIHISTDFIFTRKTREDVLPWTEKDFSETEGVYALSKKQGEEKLFEVLKQTDRLSNIEDFTTALLIRTSWVYSSHGKNFPKTILRLAGEKESLGVIEEQIGRPTYAEDLAEFIARYIDIKLKGSEKTFELLPGGIYHFSNSGVASWYDFAYEVLEKYYERNSHAIKINLRPIKSSEYPTPALRPFFSVMDLSKARTIWPNIPHWKEGVSRFLDELSVL